MNDDIYFMKIRKISKQFLCTIPLLNFDWQNIFDSFLSENQQEYILNNTVNSEIVIKYPIQINYQKLFLKRIIDKLEGLQAQSVQESTIHDDVYSAYGRLVAAGGISQENYKHYFLDDKGEEIITLKESNSFISDGTTGLITWQASLALSEWIIQNKTYFNNKTVLELGSGIGLTGLVLEKTCYPKCIYLTDCHETVLDNLRENVKINLSTISADSENLGNMNSSLKNRCLYTQKNITILNLPWEDFNTDICKGLGTVHKVIAADIVYDRDLFQGLVNAVKSLKEFCGVQDFIFSCTERNSETLNEFLALMKQTFRHIEQVTTPEQSIFLWPNDTPIKIFRFKD